MKIHLLKTGLNCSVLWLWELVSFCALLVCFWAGKIIERRLKMEYFISGMNETVSYTERVITKPIECTCKNRVKKYCDGYQNYVWYSTGWLKIYPVFRLIRVDKWNFTTHQNEFHFYRSYFNKPDYYKIEK